MAMEAYVINIVARVLYISKHIVYSACMHYIHMHGDHYITVYTYICIMSIVRMGYMYVYIVFIYIVHLCMAAAHDLLEYVRKG